MEYRLLHAIEERCRTLPDGTKITTYRREIHSLNSLEIEAGTTGYCGGDSGHGGRTYFRITDLGCTDIRVKRSYYEYGAETLEVYLGGDCELDTIIKALAFIRKVLKDERSQ
jgi:hypothetical protein